MALLSRKTDWHIEPIAGSSDPDRALEEITRLQRTSAALVGRLDLESILQRIVEDSAEGLEADRVILFLLDEKGSILNARACGPDEGLSRTTRQSILDISVPVGTTDPLSAAVVARGPYVGAGAGPSDQGSNGSGRWLHATLGTHHVNVAPLLSGERVLGVLTLDNHLRDKPVACRPGLLMAYAGVAALAIERALRDQDLEAAAEKYRKFLDDCPDGIAETTLDGEIIYCNDAILNMLGYERKDLGSLNSRMLYLDPRDREDLLSLEDGQGAVSNRKLSVKRKDGSILYLDVSFRLHRGPEGALIQSIVRDSTEHYEMVHEMQVLSSVVMNSADAVFHVDPGGRIASWNRGAESLFGYTAEEIIGSPYLTLVPPEGLAQYFTEIKEKVETEGRLMGLETEMLHKDGRRIPVSVTLSRLDKQGMNDLGVSAIVRDITERRREEDRRRLLSSITEQSFDAILSTDRDGRITSWNRGAERIFGYKVEEIVGRPWLDLAPADREEEFRATMMPLHAEEMKGLRLRTLDSVARGADGRLVPVKISVSVLHDHDDGGEAGWSVIFRDLTEQRALAAISERLQAELSCRNRLEGIVGHSAAIEDVRDRIRRVARFNSSVLVVGQSGTGKELVANAIHYNSPRSKNPFVKVNCAAIPEDLLESEMFGIERNVATGVDGRIGRFEMAAGGTLFLDEIGDMSLSTQAKILRVLQEREFERVGGKKVIKADVRIIAATNKELESEIKARRFRVDLFYRLNVIVIALPALAERREDIDPLIDHFLSRFAKANDLPRKELSLHARLLLNRYTWPGNVRELEHCIERAVVMSEGGEIAEKDLPPSILIWRDLGGTRPHTEAGTLQDVLHQVERSTVEKALERCDWVQARAARMLGISERSMWYRVKKLDLKPPTR